MIQDEASFSHPHAKVLQLSNILHVIFINVTKGVNLPFFIDKPVSTTIKFSSSPAVINQSVTIRCSYDGLPELSYIIYHNDTEVVSANKTYTISQVKREDAGKYQCIANNTFEMDSDSYYLNVTERAESKLIYFCMRLIINH